MKTKKILYTILIIIGSMTIDFFGTYAYKNFEEPSTTVVSEEIQNKLKIHYIDVGQGDSTFIELPNNKVILIDAGEKEYGDVVVNYIKKLKYEKIDYVFATHPHNDHIGGLEKVINNFEIGNIYMPNAINTTTNYLNLLKTIENKNKKIKTITKPKTIISEENLILKALSPYEKEYDELNKYSIILKLTYKDNNFLFMADSEYENEMDLLNNKIDIKADVLKIGHHGSTSSTNYNFLKEVNPSIAVISVGTNNEYGHPKDKIIEKLKKLNIKIYRTDLNSNIIVSSDGKKIKVNVKNGSYS